MIRLENYRRGVPNNIAYELFSNNFVPEEFEFPDELKERITEKEFEYIIKELNDIVFYNDDRERRLIFKRINRNCFGLSIALTGIVFVLLSLISISIQSRTASIIILYGFISIGVLISIIGLAIVAIPVKPKKWKVNGEIWASKMNEKFGEKGVIFKIDSNEENENDLISSLMIEIKNMPSKIYQFETGPMVSSIPSFIPPKLSIQTSVP